MNASCISVVRVAAVVVVVVMVFVTCWFWVELNHLYMYYDDHYIYYDDHYSIEFVETK